jgi:WD40 repeat protein
LLAIVFAMIAVCTTTAADKDQHGDPLPEGAQLRLGTTRMRTNSFTPALLSHDGKEIFSISLANSLIQRSETATGAVSRTFTGPYSATPAAISADSKRLVVTNSNSVWVIETQTDKALVKAERAIPTGNEYATAISDDGKRLAYGNLKNFGAKGKDPLSAVVWDVEANKELAKIAVPQNESVFVSLSNDGKVLATWGQHYDPTAKQPATPETDPTRNVAFWDATTGKEIAKFTTTAGTAYGVRLSADGSMAVVATYGGGIELVETKTGKVKLQLLGRNGVGGSLSFSPDGSVLFATTIDGSVQAWKVDDGTGLFTTNAPITNLVSTRVRAIDAKRGIAHGRIGMTEVIWEVPSGKVLSPNSGHVTAVSGIAVTADSKHAITSSEDGTVLKWELATGKLAETLPSRPGTLGYGARLPAGTLSSDYKYRLIRDSATFAVYDAANWSQLYTFPLPSTGYLSANFSADGSKIATTLVTNENKVRAARVLCTATATGKIVGKVSLPGYTSAQAAITTDGKYIVTAGAKPMNPEKMEFENVTFIIAVWDAATGEKKHEHSEKSGFNYVTIAIAPDNATAAITTSSAKVAALDLATGKVTTVTEQISVNYNSSIVFSADGKSIAIAGSNNFGAGITSPVYVYDWPSGKSKHKFTVPGGVSAVAFSPDGKWLVTGSSDTTATVWSLSK